MDCKSIVTLVGLQIPTNWVGDGASTFDRIKKAATVG